MMRRAVAESISASDMRRAELRAEEAELQHALSLSLKLEAEAAVMVSGLSV